jgi:hypothetical protein
VTASFRIDGILGDRPLAEVSEPAVAVADQARSLLAVAGAYGHEPQTLAPVVAVYDTTDLTCRALTRARFPVHALAFHPTLPLLAIGTGQYDGGYFFRGELLRLDWETGVATSLLEEPDGREVLGLEWLTDRELRVLLAPPDDWKDREARVEGHVAVLHRADWRAVPKQSITYADLAGPRVAAPRPDGRAEAARLVAALAPEADPRRHVRAVEELPDGRVLATLDGMGLEAWLPTGERQWTVPDAKGGQEIVVAPDGQSAWVGLVRPEWEDRPRSAPSPGGRARRTSPVPASRPGMAASSMPARSTTAMGCSRAALSWCGGMRSVASRSGCSGPTRWPPTWMPTGRSSMSLTATVRSLPSTSRTGECAGVIASSSVR